MRRTRTMRGYQINNPQMGALRYKTWLLILWLCVFAGLTLMGILWTQPSWNPASSQMISPLSFTWTVYAEEIGDQKLTPAEAQDWESMKAMARKLAPLYDYPANVIIAQMALESQRGTSRFCRERNNCLGIGAYDSNPDAAFSFDNKEQGIIEYMRLVKTRFPEAYAHRNNPEQLVNLLENNSMGRKYATDSAYVTKLMSLPEWKGL